MLSCPTWLVPHVFSCRTCSRVLCASCSTCSCASRVSCSPSSYALSVSCRTSPMSYVLSRLTWFRALRARVLLALVAHLHRATRALVPHVPRALSDLEFHVPRASRALCITLKWRTVFINSMIYLNYLKTNAKTYTYENANHFGTGKGEFKARYGNHKKLLYSGRLFKFIWNLID